jgi:dTDP-glucose 4,6-dehydratase
MTILVTGGNFVLDWVAGTNESVINLDKLTYAGNLEILYSLQGNPNHIFVQGEIGDRTQVEHLLAEHKPRAVINFAAESHVDRSIHGPGDFIETNIVGTYNLLESVRGYWSALSVGVKAAFRFLHFSTDEVYGSLAKDEPAFAETNRMSPTARIHHPRLPVTTWCVHSTTLMACRCSPPTAPTTTAPCISRKS